MNNEARQFRVADRSKLVSGIFAVFSLYVAAPVSAEPALRVAATLTTFADLAEQIGGEHVEASVIVPPRFNPHFIEPRPSDVLKVKKADLFLHGGLDLEVWRGPLLDAAGNPRAFPGGEGELDLSRGVRLLEIPEGRADRIQGDIHLFGNPHYWLHPDNVRVMAQAICDKFCAVDPGHEREYRHNLARFLGRLDRKIPEWRRQLEPHRGREIIGYHNEWLYLTEFLGLKEERCLEPKPGIPPGPKHLSDLEGYMKERGIRVLAQAAYAPRSAADALARRTGARVTLLCQSVGELPEAGDYFSFMDYNVRQLAEALGRDA